MKRIVRKVVGRANSLMSCYFGFRLAGKPTLTGYREMKRDLRLLRKQARGAAVEFQVTKLYPCYEDKHDSAGSLGGYFWQDLHVARRIFHNRPLHHVDIGSRIDGFVAHVATFRPIEIFDIRPLVVSIPNVTFTQMDLMELRPEYEQYTDSISCLHALEHFGLGRYGDPVDYDGYLKGFNNITRMLKPGGTFYFSVPLGPQRIEFHAHRVFSMSYLLEMAGSDYQIAAFSYVDDRGQFHENAAITPAAVADNFGCRYGCAIFELTKK